MVLLPKHKLPVKTEVYFGHDASNEGIDRLSLGVRLCSNGLDSFQCSYVDYVCLKKVFVVADFWSFSEL